jgi:hypothetical protein
VTTGVRSGYKLKHVIKTNKRKNGAQQWLELMLKEIRTNQEKAEAKTEAGHKELLARLESDRQASMRAWREEMAIMRNKWVNDNRDETLACQEMEARQEEKKPTSPDRKPEAAQKGEVPTENAEVMLVGAPIISD